MAIACTEDEYWKNVSTICKKLQENETREICYLIQDLIAEEWIMNGIVFDIVEKMKQANLISLNETSVLTKCLSLVDQYQLIDEINSLMPPTLEDDDDDEGEFFVLDVYPMENGRKCVIFTIANDDSYNDSAEKLKKWFNDFGFIVEHYPCKAPKHEDIYNKLSKERMNVNYDCLVIIFLCYTEQGKVKLAGKNFEIAEIRNIFQKNNCERLKGKAKIFFVISTSLDDYGFPSLIPDSDEAFCFVSMPSDYCGKRGGVSTTVQLLCKRLKKIVNTTDKTFSNFSTRFYNDLLEYTKKIEKVPLEDSQIKLHRGNNLTKKFNFTH